MPDRTLLQKLRSQLDLVTGALETIIGAIPESTLKRQGIARKGLVHHATAARKLLTRRNASIEIEIGTCSVDAGMLLLGDPCYVIGRREGPETWDAFLHRLHASNPKGGDAPYWHLPDTGCVVTTGYGDGEYPVHVTLSGDGRVKNVTVTFIKDEE